MILILGWLWRLCLWIRFLWHMSWMDLRLIPSHPDHMAGLAFVAYSARAYAIVGAALATIAAGRVANAALHESGTLTEQRNLVFGTVASVVIMFAGPLLVFSAKLLREWRRGSFEYGALASALGYEFERKWFSRDRKIGKDILDVPDFSSATDLYQVVSNVYAMRLIALDLKSLLLLAGAALLPFVPIALSEMPIDVFLKQVKALLL
jgi:hypothetical protein